MIKVDKHTHYLSGICLTHITVALGVRFAPRREEYLNLVNTLKTFQSKRGLYGDVHFQVEG